MLPRAILKTAPVGGYVIQYTCPAANFSASFQTVTFQGGAVHPLVTANGGLTAGAVVDPIFAVVGADYITFDKIDVQENASNVTATVATNNMTEYGYAFFKASATDGAQYNTVSNCVITLNKTNTNSIGIYVASHGLLGVSSIAANMIAPTNISGTNSYNKFYSNTVSTLPMASW